MSRSRKKQPFVGMSTATSEKEDKRAWHRRLRRTNKMVLSDAGDEEKLRRRNELCSLWNMSKDGKWRFRPAEWPRLMRK